MRILIIEDEKIAADRLAHIIRQYDAETEIIANIDTVKKAIDWFSFNPAPDLIFMDIHLGDGLSFDIFEQVEVSAPVIFTTAFDEYAVKAFKVNSIDYLLKPIDAEEVGKAFTKYKNIFVGRNDFKRIDIQVLEQLFTQSQKIYKSRFLVKIGEKIQSVSVDDIAFFYSKEKATYLQLKRNQHFIIDFTLEQVEEMVDPACFFRINRQYLISVEAIKEIIMYSNSRLKVLLKDFQTDDIIISREKVSNFKNWLDR